MNATKDTGGLAELPVPWHMRWMRDRALQAEWCVRDTASSFTPDAPFRLVTHGLDGTALLNESARVHDPGNPRSPKDEKGRVRKYEAPTGSGSAIYAPLPQSRRLWRDAGTKYIAEGHGKTIAMFGLGLPVLGIAGIENWHIAGRKDELHPDLAELIRAGDEVVVVPDGDFHQNPRVADGLRRLLAALAACGAVARTVDLSGQDHQKIDDQIVYWRGQQRDPLREFHRLPQLDSLQTVSVALTDHATLLERPAPRWIVKGLIPPGELTAIVGPPSCGKTFLTMDLLLAVARGLDHWHGLRIKRHGLVVHVTLEGTSLGTRHQAYMRHHGLRGGLPYVALEQPINLREDPAWLVAAIQQAEVRHGQPVVLIAIDTVNRALGGGDENSSVDMGAFLANAGKLVTAFPGCGVLLIHHLGKNEQAGARGHSSFTGNVGAELAIHHNETTGLRALEATKQREGVVGTAFSFALQRIDLGNDEDGDPVTSCVVAQQAQAVQVHATRRPSDRDFHRVLYWYWKETHGDAPVTLTSSSGNTEGRSIKADYKYIKAKFDADGFDVANRDALIEQAREVLANPDYAKNKDGASNGQYKTLLPPREVKF